MLVHVKQPKQYVGEQQQQTPTAALHNLAQMHVLPLTVRRRHSTTAVLEGHCECVSTNVMSSTGSSVDYA
eukprot:980263-Rhodomonas_salina.1